MKQPKATSYQAKGIQCSATATQFTRFRNFRFQNKITFYSWGFLFPVSNYKGSIFI